MAYLQTGSRKNAADTPSYPVTESSQLQFLWPLKQTLWQSPLQSTTICQPTAINRMPTMWMSIKILSNLQACYIWCILTGPQKLVCIRFLQNIPFKTFKHMECCFPTKFNKRGALAGNELATKNLQQALEEACSLKREKTNHSWLMDIRKLTLQRGRADSIDNQLQKEDPRSPKSKSR